MLYLAIFYLAAASSDCPGFSCKLATDHFTTGTCSYYETSHFTPMYYLTSCSDPTKPYCNFQYSANSTCTAAPVQAIIYKYPGEKCVASSNCTSQSCVNQICSGTLINNLCVSSFDCCIT